MIIPRISGWPIGTAPFLEKSQLFGPERCIAIPLLLFHVPSCRRSLSTLGPPAASSAFCSKSRYYKILQSSFSCRKASGFSCGKLYFSRCPHTYSKHWPLYWRPDSFRSYPPWPWRILKICGRTSEIPYGTFSLNRLHPENKINGLISKCHQCSSRIWPSLVALWCSTPSFPSGWKE